MISYHLALLSSLRECLNLVNPVADFSAWGDHDETMISSTSMITSIIISIIATTGINSAIIAIVC